MTIGMIVVTDDGIRVSNRDERGGCDSGFDDLTVESLQEAARILAGWMDLPSEGRGEECQHEFETAGIRASKKFSQVFGE